MIKKSNQTTGNDVITYFIHPQIPVGILTGTEEIVIHKPTKHPRKSSRVNEIFTAQKVN